MLELMRRPGRARRALRRPRVTGRVVFVRHALPGERVRASVTEDGGASFCRADAVAVLTASPARVEPPCPWARPGGCGGCDLQHVDPAEQRALKGPCSREQLRRLAGVEEKPSSSWPAGRWAGGTGCGWPSTRTAGRAAGAPQPRRPADRRLPGSPRRELDPVLAPADPGRRGRGGDRRRRAAPCSGGGGDASRGVGGRPGGSGSSRRRGVLAGPPRAAGHAGGGRRGVGAAPAAAAPGTSTAGSGCSPPCSPGRSARPARCEVVESSRQAVADGRAALADLPQVRFTPGRVEHVLGRLPGRPDVVVADPPRRGLGRALVDAVAAAGPPRVLRACDPAALARDVALFTGHGYRLAGLRAFDAFPMTHHVEVGASSRPPARTAAEPARHAPRGSAPRGTGSTGLTRPRHRSR